MKKILLILTISAAIFSCKKREEVRPIDPTPIAIPITPITPPKDSVKKDTTKKDSVIIKDTIKVIPPAKTFVAQELIDTWSFTQQILTRYDKSGAPSVQKKTMADLTGETFIFRKDSIIVSYDKSMNLGLDSTTWKQTSYSPNTYSVKALNFQYKDIYGKLYVVGNQTVTIIVNQNPLYLGFEIFIQGQYILRTNLIPSK